MMDHNPYSPPQTEVRETLAPDHALPRPKQVYVAVWLLSIELAVSLVQSILLIWLWNLSQGLTVDPVNRVVEAVTLMLDSAALFLVFTSPGKQWYKR